jgi:hypothetical protein
LVCAVIVVAWLMAALAWVALIVSMISRVLDRPSTLVDESALLPEGWRAADAQFLHDVGIRP